LIAYLDTSALVKRYVAERGSNETIALVGRADVVVTSIVSRAEIAAALARAARARVLTAAAARKAQRVFASEWPDLVRIAVSEAVVERAERLAWDHALRGYDAVHLATALSWRESVDPTLAFATFDRRLWEVARRTGLESWPARLD
jgi:predicted nucleic acid-binding protein